MSSFLTVIVCLGVLAAGLLGTTLSVPLQSPALIILGVAGIVAAFVTFRNGQGRDIKNRTDPLLLSIRGLSLLSLLYFIVRAWCSPVSDLAIEDLFLILAAGLLYLLGGVAVSTPAGRVSLAATILLLMSLHLGSAAMQLFGGAEGYSLAWLFAGERNTEGNELTGMYGYRGSFAHFVGIGGFLSLSLGLWGRFPKGIRLLLCLLAVAALVLACLASSRSTMVSLVGGAFALLVLLWISVNSQKEAMRSRFRFVIIAFGCLALLGGIVSSVWVFQKRAQHSTIGADVFFDSDVRLAFWSMAVDQWTDYPLIGAGARSFSYQCFHYWSPNMDTGEANPEFVHNEYLQLLADYGLVGLCLVLGLILLHLILGVKQVWVLSGKIQEDGWRQGSNAMALAIAGVVGIVFTGVHAMFDFRTHLLANLLLVVCCFVWVLPVLRPMRQSEPGKGGVWRSNLMAAVLLILGSGGVYAGVIQLYGGVPLLKKRMAVETGTWYPESAPRDVWIPSLESSVNRAPSYRRYLRLGTLYRLEADSLEGGEREGVLRKAQFNYEKAAERHAFEPVSRVNLALVHSALKEYPIADAYFKKANELGSSRERWFRIHTKWAGMQCDWAGSLWQNGDHDAAELHYLRAFEILKQGSVQSGDTIKMYLRVTIQYARMLDTLDRYEEADRLFEAAEENLPLHRINSLIHNIRREMGEHYLRKGKHLWYRRKPDQAKQALIKSKRSFRIHQVVLEGRDDPQWQKGYDEVIEILQFFKTTGVGEGDE